MLLSEYIGVTHSEFEKTGAFDPIIDKDTPLFINFSLLRLTSIKEFTDSNEKLKSHFRQVISLLSHSDYEGDRYWNAAMKCIESPEVASLCIGYSSDGTRGGGIGPEIAKRILTPLSSFIQKGITDPAIIELVGIFGEGIGPDRLSDMIANIIKDNLKNYTIRILSELNIKIKDDERFIDGLPVNPYSKKDELILLVPQELLKELPVAVDWDDIERAFKESQKIKKDFDHVIAKELEDMKSEDRQKYMLDFFASSAEGLKRLLGIVGKQRDIEPYPIQFDPKGLYMWHDLAKGLVAEFPTGELKKNMDPISTVEIICGQFKKMIEDNALRKIVFERGGRLPERFWQLLFGMSARIYCEANYLDISPESNSGRGSVDFKISRGTDKVLVELKLSDNPQLVHGYEKQIEEYGKSENTKALFYFVIINGIKGKKNLENIQSLVAKDTRNIKIITADATTIASASII